MNRRQFLSGAAAAAIAGRGSDRAAAKINLAGTWPNLVPEFPSSAPNYWCTWAAQNYMYGHNLPHIDPKVLEGESGSNLAHNAMTEENLFGANGWVNKFYPKVRKDLFFLLDDGWETGGTATFELDTAKFSSFTGNSADRLRQLNRTVEEAGWRGAGLWCRNPPGGNQDHRLEIETKAAGIRYWKIDIGDPTFNLVRLRNETHIPLTLEHVHGELPLNGDWMTDGRFGVQPSGSRRIEILKHTDIYRTYDVTSILSLPTTIDRLAEMLKGAQEDSQKLGLLNLEDEVYLAAAMGCTMGILRHPLSGLRPGDDVDLFFNGPRKPKLRMDEVVRALRWQRIAPPFAAGLGSVRCSDEILTDTWTFERGETWQREIIGETVRQGAPACVTRNLALPDVKAKGDKPFIFGSRFPNGAVAIAAQERTQVNRAWYMPPCEVTLSVSDAPGPFGIFGDFDKLTLVCERALQGRRILAQDLAGDESRDISDRVRIQGKNLEIPGGVIRDVGLQSATAGDLSAPAVLIAIA